MDRIYILCCVFSISGIMSIYFVSASFVPPTFDIDEVDKEMVGTTVTVSGKIMSHNYHKDGHLFMTISDGTGSMRVTIFSDLASRINPDNVAKSVTIRVTGNVDEYKGNLQIIPRSPNDVSFE